MYALCIRYVNDRTVAEDLLQEGFVTLFSKLESYKGDGSFEGWARRVFTTTALMYLRKKDVLRISDDIANARSVMSETTTQMQDISYRELLGFISMLPPGFRTVFNLYVIEGYSHKEIGQMLDISETTSRTQLSRARAWLQNKINNSRNV